jgi:phosphatidate cytidylyltransferase
MGGGIDASADAERGALAGLSSRLIIAVPGVILAIAVVALGGIAFALVLAVIAALGLYEFYSLTAAGRPLRWAGYLGALSLIALAWAMNDPEHGILLGLGLSLLLVAVAGLILPRRDEITARMAMTLLGVVYLGLPLALLVIMRDLPDGAGAVVNVLVGVWVFDTASYVGGRMWGRRPIAPLTSPKKTVEGAVVGLVAATFAVWVAGLYMDWIGGWHSLILGLAICPAAFLGDLFESVLKRDAGAKDSGRLLLGHGGVLDRFDALLFGSVAAYFLTIWLVY